jgi:hypothetical protein
MSITRRNFLSAVPPALAAGALVTSPVVSEAATETPMQKVLRLRRELIDATKEAYPAVTDWRVIDEPDHGRIVGMFMLLGHQRRPA